MKVLWFGIDDTKACVLYNHEVRCELRDKHGVRLVGPGYSWPMEAGRMALSSVLAVEGKPDWVVLDDGNGAGYVPIDIDCHPDGVRFAWREGDWHNGWRKGIADQLEPDVVLGMVDRLPPLKQDLDPYLFHPGFHLVPHSVQTKRFYPGDGPRQINMVLYGQTGACYETRTKARSILSGRTDVKLPTHGGYWSDGRGSAKDITYYNDELAELLRHCKMAWVDGSDYNVCLMKYFEVAACGALLVGEKPYAWHRYFPDGCMVVCEPEELPDVINFYAKYEKARKRITDTAWEHIQKHHTVEVRAREIMAILEGWR